MTPERRRLLAVAALVPATIGGALAPARRLPVDPGRAPDAVVDVWPGAPPGAQGVAAWRSGAAPARPELRGELRGVVRPVLALWRPARAGGGALLVLPGGGYGFVSWDNEGAGVARALLPDGLTVGVLAYRLPGDRLGWAEEADAPLQDAQRALRLLREDAAARGADPRDVGVLGFSAGGHLAGRVATQAETASYPAVDAVDRRSARPAYAGLLYPVVTLEPPYAHTGSRRALVGDDMARAPALSVQGRVRAGQPPVFVAHALDDATVDPDNSLILQAALRRAGVPHELHLFAEGGHGFGVTLPPDLPGAAWPQLFDRWRRRLATASG